MRGQFIRKEKGLTDLKKSVRPFLLITKRHSGRCGLFRRLFAQHGRSSVFLLLEHTNEIDVAGKTGSQCDLLDAHGGFQNQFFRMLHPQAVEVLHQAYAIGIFEGGGQIGVAHIQLLAHKIQPHRRVGVRFINDLLGTSRYRTFLLFRCIVILLFVQTFQNQFHTLPILFGGLSRGQNASNFRGVSIRKSLAGSICQKAGHRLLAHQISRGNHAGS